MRIQEILKESDYHKSGDLKGDVLNWFHNNFRKTGVHAYSWSFDSDGKVHGEGHFWLKPVEEIKYPMGVLAGSLRVDGEHLNHPLESLKNFPEVITNILELNSLKDLKDFTGLPKCYSLTLFDLPHIKNFANDILIHLKAPIEELTLSCPSVTSLVGMDIVKHPIKSINVETFYIERGGMGILLIPGLQKLNMSKFTKRPDFRRAAEIVEEYVGRPADIYECQARLIDEGLERFAEI